MRASPRGLWSRQVWLPRMRQRDACWAGEVSLKGSPIARLRDGSPVSRFLYIDLWRIPSATSATSSNSLSNLCLSPTPKLVCDSLLNCSSRSVYTLNNPWISSLISLKLSTSKIAWGASAYHCNSLSACNLRLQINCSSWDIILQKCVTYNRPVIHPSELAQFVTIETQLHWGISEVILDTKST